MWRGVRFKASAERGLDTCELCSRTHSTRAKWYAAAALMLASEDDDTDL
jgi:hypothetical protein